MTSKKESLTAFLYGKICHILPETRMNCGNYGEDKGENVEKNKKISVNPECYNGSVDRDEAERSRRMRKMLSARQYEIVAYLKKADGYVPVSEIADSLQVSPKTVRNEINTIRQLLQENELGEIDSKSHAGVRLSISQECWEKWKASTQARDSGISRDKDLVCEILCELLKKQTVSYPVLEKQLCVTRSVIERLLPKVTEWLSANEITLEKEKGVGLTLKIPYLKQRYIWSSALIRLWSDMEKNGLTKTTGYFPDREASEKMHFYESFLEGFDLNGVVLSVRKTEERFGFRFTYEGFQQVMLMVSLSVMQVRRHQAMDFFAIRTGKTDSEFDEMSASYLISLLERRYQIVIPMTERDYIAYSMEVTDIQGFTDMEAKLFCQSRSLEMCRCTVKIATLMEDITGQDLKKDDFFVESLFLQLRSMIGRRKYEIRQKNPLVRQVRQKYNDIFVAIHGIAVFMEKELGIVMNEDETCSLVLLLGGALLRGVSVVDACLICNYYGIGSAHFLKKRLEKEVNDLNIVAEFSARDLVQVRNCQCDLIISAVPIENSFEGKPVVQVEDLLLDYDIAAVETAMKEIRKKKVHSNSISKMFETKKALFQKEFVWMHMKCRDKYSVIRAMCEKLADAGYVTEEFGDSVIARERKLPTEIGQKMAIPHGDADDVIRSVVAVAVLDQEIQWGEEENVDRVFLLAFNPDESLEMKDKILRFYKNFVTLLDEPKLYDRFRNITGEKELVDMMNEVVDQQILLYEE